MVEQDRPDVAERRHRWRVWQRYMDAARFVFLDETGLTTKMTRLYGRSRRGERLVGAVPHEHWRKPPSSPDCDRTALSRLWCLMVQ